MQLRYLIHPCITINTTTIHVTELGREIRDIGVITVYDPQTTIILDLSISNATY